MELQPQMLMQDEESEDKVVEPTIINGYDGYGGVHDNIVWLQQDGEMIYTFHNKVIIENSKTREQ